MHLIELSSVLFQMLCVSASVLCINCQDDAQVLEIFDQFDGKHLPSPMPDDTVCNFSNSSIEADIVKEAITVKNKPKESSLLSSDAALHIAKQLSSYISESAEGNMFYLVTQAIKGEKCDPGNEAMHVIHAVIKETDCDKKEIEEWGSHSGCRVIEHYFGHHCIWIGKVKESKVTENHGIFCEVYFNSYSFFSSAQPLCQSLRYHNTGMLRVTPANAKFFEGSFVAYKPPDFSASYPKEKSFDDFDPSHKKINLNGRDGSIDRRPMDNKKYAVKDGRPLNPGGFTGLQGRGVHPHWGPNFMAIFVITRREGDKLEVLSTSSSLKPVSFPHFYVDNYDLPTLSSQLEKIILHSNSQNSHSGEEIKKIVKEAMHHSTLSRKHVGLLDLKPTESLDKVGWKLLDKTEQKNLLNTISKAIGKDNLNEVAAEVERKRSKKISKALLVAGLIGRFFSGLSFVVAVVAFICTGSLLPVLGAVGLLVAFSVLSMALKSIAWILSAFLVSASLCDLQDDAQVLEIFDQFDGKHLPSPMPDDTVCNFSNSSIEADIVKEAITVKNKPKESSLLSSDAALHIAKQLSSYISESAEGNMFYLVTQAIKGEKCDPGNEAMHVIHAVIKETDCDKKEIEEWGSHSGCRVIEHYFGHHCIWIGKVKESKVTENHGIFCESYSFFSSAQPLCQSLRYHNTGMLRVTPANAKFFEGSFVAYKPPDFSASYPKEKSFDDFDPSHKDGSIDRRPMDNKKYAVKDGRPLNPGGFTGLQGRGVHPHWGPNFMAIFVITRREGDKLEVLSTSSSLKPVSFPHFYVDNYDLPTLSSQLEKIILHSNSQNSHSGEEIKKIVKEAMHHSTLLKQGFTPDASNTDNSWLETVIVQINDQSRKHVGLLDLKPTESLDKVGWKLLDKTEQKNLLNTLSKAIGKDNLNEVAAEQDDAQVLEIFDQFDGKHLPSPMPDDTVCNFSNSSIEADIVKEAITVKNKPKESSLLSSDAALHIAKQLSSYISESAEGNMFYLVTQAIKGEKCDPGNEAMHIEEWGSHSGCRVIEHYFGHHCIWIGKVKESKVTENHGIFCEVYFNSYSFFSSAQPLCQSLRYHNTGMLRVTPANAKFFEGSFVAYKPPDFSASYPKEKSFDDFDPSHKDGSIDRRPMDNKKYAVKDGRPLNPGGFTGLQGRGVHPHWGPNFMAIFVITRREGDKLEVLSTSSSLKPVSFPHFYVDNYDLPTLSSQLEKIILHSNSQNSHSGEEIKKIVKEAMHHSTLLKQGFTPDASNTDNSWLETVIVQINDQSRKHVGLLDLKPTESLDKVGWKLLDKTEQKNLLNTLSKAIGKDNLNEVAAEVGKKRSRKLLKALVVAGLIGKFLSGIGLVVSLVALVCTGSLIPVLGALGLLVAFSVLSVIALQHTW
ncbi:ADP-ribose pyrophosphatase, mitochondrial [Trichinella sp. T9]|nr:ADP-ribose pyrophosphatase, mitochondrial [Trichinella sp. T9]